MDNSLKKNDDETRLRQYQLQKNLHDAGEDIKKIEWDYLPLYADKDTLRDNCKAANGLVLGAMVVLPMMVKSCVAFFGKYPNTKLIATISYPHGADSTEVKELSVKQVFKDGADAVEVYAPAMQIKEGNFSYFKKECKKIKKVAKGRPVRFVFDCSVFTLQEVSRCCQIIMDLGLSGVRLSKALDGEYVRKLTAMIKNKIVVKIDKCESYVAFHSAISWGANRVGTSNGLDLSNALVMKAREV
jgi:deoxyribose-phosphate aldolase